MTTYDFLTKQGVTPESEYEVLVDRYRDLLAWIVRCDCENSKIRLVKLPSGEEGYQCEGCRRVFVVKEWKDS